MFESSPPRALFTALLVIAAGCGDVVRPAPDAGSLPNGSGGDASPADAAVSDAAVSDAPPIAAPTVVSLTTGTDAKKAGAAGDTPTTDLCASGQALTGFSGKNNDLGTDFLVVGTLGGTCAAAQLGSATAAGYAVAAGSTTRALPQRGTANSTAWTLACPANQFVVGVTTHSGDGLDQFQVQCAPMSLVQSASSWVGQTGTAALVAGKAGGDGGELGSGACPAGQVATGYVSELWSTFGMASVTLKCSVVAGQ